MPLKHLHERRYEETYKQAAVDFMNRNGASIEMAAAELGIDPEDLRNWHRRQAGKLPRAMSGLAQLRAENEALRTQIAQLQVQWDILKTTLGVLSTASYTPKTV